MMIMHIRMNELHDIVHFVFGSTLNKYILMYAFHFAEGRQQARLT